MDKPKFTPRPWRARLIANQKDIHSAEYPVYWQLNSSAGYMASIKVYKCRKQTQEEAQANAHLIATAPEMYDVLKETINFMDDIYPAEVFTGESGDEGPARVIELRRKIEQTLILAEKGR